MNAVARTETDPGLESLLAFWAMAGVDACYDQAPVDRTVRPTPILRAQTPPTSLARSQAAAQAASTADIDRDALGKARELAASADSIEALAAAIAAFDGCPLKAAGARQAVFARGAADAPVMLIGEAPGADEDLQGLPFVGRAGKLLDRMLDAAGLTGRVFITNTVFWRPPGNRTPTPAEQQVCAPFLERAIELVNPCMLLLVGGASAKSMLGVGDGILSLRGRWFDWRSRDGDHVLPALPTLHPAFLLRQPGAKKKAWDDLLTLTERLDRPGSAT